MPKVNREALADCWLWFPEMADQQEILETVDRECVPFNVAINRTEREITLLREYRTRLIADVVTGKLDVRAAAVNLPEEADEREALIEADVLAEGEDTADGDLDAAPEEAEA